MAVRLWRDAAANSAGIVDFSESWSRPKRSTCATRIEDKHPSFRIRA
jgi:hypothetical protein